MRLFLDSADLNEMRKYRDKVDGFTTNPTLMRRAGVTDYVTWAKEVVQEFPEKTISFEVVTDDRDEMCRQAEKIASWGPNVYVKIPIVTTGDLSAWQVIHSLSSGGVQINVTAVLYDEQVQSAVKCLAYGTRGIVSVFAGRIADTGRDPAKEIAARRLLPGHELLWASTREVYNYIQAEEAGYHIITMPPDLVDKLYKVMGKDLRTMSRDTVQQFVRDAQEAGYTL